MLAVALLLAAIGVPVVVAEPLRVTSISMSPTLHDGDHVLVQKLGGHAHAPHRRDIVAFHLAGHAGLLVKRVVGVGGDTVGIEDGVLVVNGASVREPFLDYGLVDATYFGPVVVPAGSVFTMGDNRSNSTDSRSFGPVRTGDLTGRVVLTLHV